MRLDPPAPRLERRRARKLVALAEALSKPPFEGVALPDGSGRAARALQALADRLQGREAAQLEAFEQALALAGGSATAAYDAQDGWLDALRAGLVALLEFFDEEPALARYLVVHSTQAGPAVLARRSEVLDALARLLDDERAPARSYPPPLTARALVGGVLAVLHERLSRRDPGTLAELSSSLMSFIVLPLLGARAARRELARPLEMTPTFGLALRDRSGGPNARTVSVLRLIASEPGLNNRALALRAGVNDKGHMSRLLRRLERLGLIENTPADGPSHPNAWRLAVTPGQLEAAIAHVPPAPKPSVALELMRSSGSRLKQDAVSALRAIASQPGLSNAAVALRVGIRDQNSISHLLARLARRGLIQNTRTGGRQNAWRLTPSGVELERAIARERSVADRATSARRPLRDRPGDPVARLNHRTVSVLAILAAEPGLSNAELTERMGLTAKGHTSTLLARLARRGLIVNTAGAPVLFQANAWRLTASGAELEIALRGDLPTTSIACVGLGAGTIPKET